MWHLILLCSIICGVSSHFNPSGGLHGIPIEAGCFTFFGRQNIQLPLRLDIVQPTTAGTSNTIRQLARHHVIPLSTLTNFFNRAVALNSRTDNTILSGFMNLYGYLSGDALDLYQGSLGPYIRRHLTGLRNLQTLYVGDDENFNNPSLDTLFSAQYLMRSVYQWMPANIFIGPLPEHRSDDPGNSFEVNSRHIIGEDNYQRLATINRMMNYYTQTGELATFNEIIELLSEISRGRQTPYPYQPDQWMFDSNTNKYKINTNPNNRGKRHVSLSLMDSDPFCVKPLEMIKMSIEEYNLMIVAKAIERTRNHLKFSKKHEYKSWKDWYQNSTWEFGIYGDGKSMAGEGWYYEPYGYTFEDNSFVVGILGTDARNEKDNWVNLSHDFRDTKSKSDYAGQAYFDKNGRPVAIVITSHAWGQAGAGWSFIYVNGKWEYESTDTWDERRFAHTSDSLDPNSSRFVME